MNVQIPQATPLVFSPLHYHLFFAVFSIGPTQKEEGWTGGREGGRKKQREKKTSVNKGFWESSQAVYGGELNELMDKGPRAAALRGDEHTHTHTHTHIYQWDCASISPEFSVSRQVTAPA